MAGRAGQSFGHSKGDWYSPLRCQQEPPARAFGTASALRTSQPFASWNHGTLPDLAASLAIPYLVY